jgi:hypothetical protein
VILSSIPLARHLNLVAVVLAAKTERRFGHCRIGHQATTTVPGAGTASHADAAHRHHGPPGQFGRWARLGASGLGPVLAKNYSSFIFFQKSFFGLNSRKLYKVPKFIEIHINHRKLQSKFL